MTEPFLQLLDISKTYPGVTALEGVSLTVSPGEVVGLVGENGAGKSTLMKILGGVTEPTTGTIRIDGRDHAGLSVREAIDAGIAFVHQELNLFDNLDAAANVYIGREPVRGGWLRLVDRKRLHADVRPLMERLGVDFAPDTPVSRLSIAQQQLLEIVKALSLHSRLVIMDEPTSSLTISETERLMQVVADLKASGISVIYISHRLNELVACADRVMVLRDGHTVGMLGRDEIAPAAMIRLMIGRDLQALYVPPARASGAARLAIRGMRTDTYPDHAVDLDVHAGEILGLAGLVGSGRTELARAAFGIDRPAGGELLLDGEPLRVGTPAEAIRSGFFLVPEDRKRSGAVLGMSIAQNVTLPDLGAYAPHGLVDTRAERAVAETQKERLNIRAPDVRVEVAALSGGNQQKVVLAKWLAMKPKAIVFDEPTRGIDVGAKKEIYEMLRALADSGVAILMISSDMEEVIGVSDRVAVMHEGEIAGFLDRKDFSERNVLRLAVGHGAHAEEEFA